ncbi:hypothetical protein HII17_11055 [Thalassotalea sp. M1531]|uniref:O-antigen ligase-related domain-containing protein n=1 Tax=Thalassotalea algicola TaxID=2716224 RepID=A0A7Y0LD40_9GAMM|nr:O-antigen ligase family protein [Thalassotalea algicola]NMP32107.1 hypothetical protein [Thalassotalea algicola]
MAGGKINLFGLCALFFIVAITLYIFPNPMLLIVVGVIPFLLWGLLRFSFFVVLAFVVFSFFRIHEVFPVLSPLKLPQLLALGSLFVVFLRLFFMQNLAPYWCRQFTYLALFFSLVTLTLPFSANVDVGFKAWSGTYSKVILMTFVVAWMMRKESHFVAAHRIFILAGFCVAGIALLNKASGIGLVEGTRVTIGRDIGSLLGDPNDLALVLLYPLAFATSAMLEKELPRWERLFGVIAFILLFMAILATQSRGGLLGFVAVVGVFAYNKVKSKMLIISVGTIGLLLLFAIAGISERSSGGAAEEGIDESAMGRLYAWQAAWNMAVDNPVGGVGISNFYYNYFFYSAHWDGLNHAVHSTWFGVLAETGFVGLGLFVALVFTTFKVSWKLLKNKGVESLSPGMRVVVYAAPAGIVGFIVSGTFLTQGFIWPIYLQVAMVAALAKHCEKQLAKQQNKMSPFYLQNAKLKQGEPLSY